MVSTVWEIMVEWWTISFRRDDNIEAQKFELYITKDYMNNDLIRLLGYVDIYRSVVARSSCV